MYKAWHLVRIDLKEPQFAMNSCQYPTEPKSRHNNKQLRTALLPPSLTCHINLESYLLIAVMNLTTCRRGISMQQPNKILCDFAWEFAKAWKSSKLYNTNRYYILLLYHSTHPHNYLVCARLPSANVVSPPIAAATTLPLFTPPAWPILTMVVLGWAGLGTRHLEYTYYIL